MAFFYPTMGARPCYLGDGAHDSCWWFSWVYVEGISL
jgi:hypothetical protein